MNNSDNKIILLVSLIGIFQKKFTPPEGKGILKNITGEEAGGGGLLPLGIQRRGSEPKTTSCGVIFIDISVASIDKFSKNCFAFLNFIILSNYRHLSTFILYKFLSMGSPSLVL